MSDMLGGYTVYVPFWLQEVSVHEKPTVLTTEPQVPQEYNQFDDVPPFGDPKKLKQVEIALRRTNAIPYLRTDAKGQLVQGK